MKSILNLLLKNNFSVFIQTYIRLYSLDEFGLADEAWDIQGMLSYSFIVVYIRKIYCYQFFKLHFLKSEERYISSSKASFGFERII